MAIKVSTHQLWDTVHKMFTVKSQTSKLPLNSSNFAGLLKLFCSCTCMSCLWLDRNSSRLRIVVGLTRAVPRAAKTKKKNIPHFREPLKKKEVCSVVWEMSSPTPPSARAYLNAGIFLVREVVFFLKNIRSVGFYGFVVSSIHTYSCTVCTCRGDLLFNRIKVMGIHVLNSECLWSGWPSSF